MTPEERNLINGLFDRLRTADKVSKDREAEQLIQQKVSGQPSAPYLMAQTVLVQEQALNNAQARIKELESRLAEASNAQHAESGGGSFLSGLFGGKSAGSAPSQPSAPPPLPASQQAAGGGYQQGGGYAPSAPAAPAAGGGFLRTALAAAAGVAGGSLLYQGLENMLGRHAGSFGSQMGMGGNFMEAGYGGRPSEIIENREVVNNYYDNENRGHEGGGGGAGGDAMSNTGDNEATGDYSTPPHDDFVDTNDNAASVDNGDYSSPPQDDPSDSSLFDSGSDSGSSYDDNGSNDNLV
jgi:hypothetical protein